MVADVLHVIMDVKHGSRLPFGGQGLGFSTAFLTMLGPGRGDCQRLRGSHRMRSQGSCFPFCFHLAALVKGVVAMVGGRGSPQPELPAPIAAASHQQWETQKCSQQRTHFSVEESCPHALLPAPCWGLVLSGHHSHCWPGEGGRLSGGTLKLSCPPTSHSTLLLCDRIQDFAIQSLQHIELLLLRDPSHTEVEACLFAFFLTVKRPTSGG